MIPNCKSCGLPMRKMLPMTKLDWWDCECGQCYDRAMQYWGFEE